MQALLAVEPIPPWRAGGQLEGAEEHAQRAAADERARLQLVERTQKLFAMQRQKTAQVEAQLRALQLASAAAPAAHAAAGAAPAARVHAESSPWA